MPSSFLHGTMATTFLPGFWLFCLSTSTQDLQGEPIPLGRKKLTFITLGISYYHACFLPPSCHSLDHATGWNMSFSSQSHLPSPSYLFYRTHLPFYLPADASTCRPAPWYRTLPLTEPPDPPGCHLDTVCAASLPATALQHPALVLRAIPPRTAPCHLGTPAILRITPYQQPYQHCPRLLPVPLWVDDGGMGLVWVFTTTHPCGWNTLPP